MSLVVNLVEFQNVFEIMERILKDRTVPKNIRIAVENSKNVLESSDEPTVKISTAIQILDEVINDPNMPMYTRTHIWNIVSILEEKRKELG
ncbi:MAG: UPF0147 family protein [Candidatus Aenigmarchaeota archaeon]|nr:UPF0147 family protein [Candidatus Aenigmarchaeota archaeon]